MDKNLAKNVIKMLILPAKIPMTNLGAKVETTFFFVRKENVASGTFLGSSSSQALTWQLCDQKIYFIEKSWILAADLEPKFSRNTLYKIAKIDSFKTHQYFEIRVNSSTLQYLIAVLVRHYFWGQNFRIFENPSHQGLKSSKILSCLSIILFEILKTRNEMHILKL